MKPAAKARSAKMKPVVSLLLVKNLAPMIAASEPNTKKSYHSNTVPSEEAKMTLRSSAVIGRVAGRSP